MPTSSRESSLQISIYLLKSKLGISLIFVLLPRLLIFCLINPPLKLLFFTAPKRLSFKNISALTVNGDNQGKIVESEPLYRFTAEVIKGDDLAF